MAGQKNNKKDYKELIREVHRLNRKAEISDAECDRLVKMIKTEEANSKLKSSAKLRRASQETKE